MFNRGLCLCIALFAMICLLPAHAASAPGADTFYIEVDITNQITTVFRSSDRTIVRQMICSTGTGNNTPRGTFKLETSRSSDRKAWYYIPKYGCYVKYPTRIQGPILFHSIPYSAKDMGTIDPQALDELGAKASHGCIRLRWLDAMWIARNCPDGTRVHIFYGAARKNPLRRLLLAEGYSAEMGMSYEQFVSGYLNPNESGRLEPGATGSDVTELQQRLSRLGFMRGKTSDVYDRATFIAVMRYQSATGQPASGYVTAAQIEQIMAAGMPGAHSSVPNQGANGNAVSVSSAVFKNDADASTSMATASLVLISDSGMRHADLTPAERTIDAIANTLDSLRSAARRAYRDHNVPTAGSVDMSSGSVGKGVVMLQERLRALGFYSAPSVPLYDANTAEAVGAYQLAAGLAPSGEASVELQNQILAGDAITGTRVPLHPNDISPAVSALQRALAALQYYKGPCDGNYDGDTEQAVRLFTRTNGMPESGEASPEVQLAVINQYLDCEAEFGSGNYVLNLVDAESRLAKTRSKTSLYSRKSTDSEPVMDLRRGARVTVLEEGDNWCRISVRGKRGYVRTKHLRLSAQAKQVATFLPADAADQGAIAFGNDEESQVAAPPTMDDSNATTEDYNGIIVEEFEEIPEEDETVAIDGETVPTPTSGS